MSEECPGGTWRSSPVRATVTWSVLVFGAFLAANGCRASGGAEKPPVAAPAACPSAVVSSEAAPAAPVTKAARIEKDSGPEVLAVHEIDPDRFYVVDDLGATLFVSNADAGPASSRCVFPSGAAVVGTADTGRVALGIAPSANREDGAPYAIELMDVLHACAVESTKLTIPVSDIDGVSRLSSDGTRLVLQDEGDDQSGDVYDLTARKKITHCATHPPTGGSNVEVAISADGKNLVWQHGRQGTWIQPIASCSEYDRESAGTSDSSALVSPHARLLVDCPYRKWGTDAPTRGFFVRSVPGGHVVTRLSSDAFADDDYGICSRVATAFSNDDSLLALAGADGVHIWSTRDGREHARVGRTTLGAALGSEPVEAACFSPKGDRFYAASRHGVARIDLAAYRAYLAASPMDVDSEIDLLSKALTTFSLP